MIESKPSNPKDALGSNKIPFHLWPETASILGALALADGAMKYGRANFRAIGVRASIYYDAARRHMNAWFEGDDTDPESGLPHLAHALACLAILVDAQAAGQFTDDRNIFGGYQKMLKAHAETVKRLREKHAHDDPRHYTIKDGVVLPKQTPVFMSRLPSVEDIINTPIGAPIIDSKSEQLRNLAEFAQDIRDVYKKQPVPMTATERTDRRRKRAQKMGLTAQVCEIETCEQCKAFDE